MTEKSRNVFKLDGMRFEKESCEEEKNKSRDRERRNDAGLGWNTSTASACFTTAHTGKNYSKCIQLPDSDYTQKEKRQEIITQPRLINGYARD